MNKIKSFSVFIIATIMLLSSFIFCPNTVSATDYSAQVPNADFNQIIMDSIASWNIKEGYNFKVEEKNGDNSIKFGENIISDTVEILTSESFNLYANRKYEFVIDAKSKFSNTDAGLFLRLHYGKNSTKNGETLYFDSEKSNDTATINPTLIFDCKEDTTATISLCATVAVSKLKPLQ